MLATDFCHRLSVPDVSIHSLRWDRVHDVRLATAASPGEGGSRTTTAPARTAVSSVPRRLFAPHKSAADSLLWMSKETCASLPEDSVTAKSVAYFGMNLEEVGLLRLVGRRLKTFFCPGFRKKLYRTERSLFIPRACLRHALPLPRFVMGPTVAVAYELPGEKTLRIEDFTLCTIGGNQVRTPTADPNGWACDLGLPEPSLKLPTLLFRRRAAMCCRIALADMGVAVVVSGAIVFTIASTFSVILASERGPAQGMALFGIIAGIWGLTMTLRAACHLRCER